MHTREQLISILEFSKRQQANPDRIGAVVAAQHQLLEALMEAVFPAPASELERAPQPALERAQPAELERAPEPARASQRPGIAHHNAAEGVHLRPMPQASPDPSVPTFSSIARQHAAHDVHQRQTGQHPSVIPGVTPSGDLNLHGGVVATGPANSPTPAAQATMHVFGPGAPGGSPGVSFRPASPPENAAENPALPREPIVELRAAEPEQRSDATVEFAPAAPPVEATPYKGQE